MSRGNILQHVPGKLLFLFFKFCYNFQHLTVVKYVYILLVFIFLKSNYCEPWKCHSFQFRDVPGKQLKQFVSPGHFNWALFYVNMNNELIWFFYLLDWYIARRFYDQENICVICKWQQRQFFLFCMICFPGTKEKNVNNSTKNYEKSWKTLAKIFNYFV